jgi:hypothetical protein
MIQFLKRNFQPLFKSCLLASGIFLCQSALSQNSVTAGQFIVETPTLENLGFEWMISGDDNRNASVAVAFREKGARNWREGLPLFRLQNEEVRSILFTGAFNSVTPNMFAGSIFDLEPDTLYEAQFTLTDPDGVSGEVVKNVEVRTRPEPMPAEDGRVFHVYPFDYEGPREEPAFKGLLSAYFMSSADYAEFTPTEGGDWYNAFPPRVRPGDTILVHAGVYQDQRFRYGHELLSGWTECCNTTGDGTYYLTAKGTAERPIVIKAAGDGEVVFDGDGNNNLFNVMAADYHYFEGLTFRNTFIAFEAGLKSIAGAVGLSFKHNTFEDIGIGIHTDWGGSRDFYIADNYFTGRHDPDFLVPWSVSPNRPNWEFWSQIPNIIELSNNQSQFAVKVYGSGHVIAYNSVYNFHDGIDHATYGEPDNWPFTPRDRMPVSIDIYNNDIYNVHDNCVEADGAMYNIRVMRNRCFNSALQAYSLQPLMGGPAYFIRNITYNSPASGAMKFSQRPAGGVFYHNTWFSNVSPGTGNEAANVHLRNNLILGQYDAPVMGIATLTNYSSSDYNGYFVNDNRESAPFLWYSPAFGVDKDFRERSLVNREFDTLQEFSEASGQESHSILIDPSIFQNVVMPDPDAPISTVYSLEDIDYRLRRGSAAVDRGEVLPNINDGFSGRAPDLGAIEFGDDEPHFGPRPR